MKIGGRIGLGKKIESFVLVISFRCVLDMERRGEIRVRDIDLVFEYIIYI